MAQWDQLVCALGRHYAGDARGGEHVALRRITSLKQRQCLRLHGNKAFGDGCARRHGLVGHIDHMGFACLVHVAQSAALRHGVVLSL